VQKFCKYTFKNELLQFTSKLRVANYVTVYYSNFAKVQNTKHDSLRFFNTAR